mmetsp:Transcript_4762/g.17281  ORF Transcript_4762/g.17281 Transcript_4762/m.17281 type:complete len:203 (-) Transcript_4762:4796-5404(-)
MIAALTSRLFFDSFVGSPSPKSNSMPPLELIEPIDPIDPIDPVDAGEPGNGDAVIRALDLLRRKRRRSATSSPPRRKAPTRETTPGAARGEADDATTEPRFEVAAFSTLPGGSDLRTSLSDADDGRERCDTAALSVFPGGGGLGDAIGTATSPSTLIGGGRFLRLFLPPARSPGAAGTLLLGDGDRGDFTSPPAASASKASN